MLRICRHIYLYPSHWFLSIIVCLTVLGFFSCTAKAEDLRSGWYDRAPYQTSIREGDKTRLTGLDIAIVQEIFAVNDQRVRLTQSNWSAMMHDLRHGNIDVVSGAYFYPQREEFAWYSKPYRSEHNAVYFHTSHPEAGSISSLPGLFAYLSNHPLRMAVLSDGSDFYYGHPDVQAFFDRPPSQLNMVETSGYSEAVPLLIEGDADMFIGNPVITDKMISSLGAMDRVIKVPLAFQDIPVHLLLSKQHFTSADVEQINNIIDEMQQQKRFRALHIEFILPAYLAITTNKTWFGFITILGIVSFCISGVLLARKERYNFFGALVLAILPAIGGGVLRDLLLGVNPVFVVDSPMYMQVAVAVVVGAFLCFKVYDTVHAHDNDMGEKIGQLAQKRIGRLFGRLAMFFDAWAVATFTVIGVGVAVETGSSPLWLWGPAMGALTASGGVVLRDVVRADFNISMLKQDSYAEISIAGGLLYVFLLMYLPLNIGMELIMYLTMGTISILFLFRLYILYRGYESPLQFGSPQTHPALRMQRFERLEPQLWDLLNQVWIEDDEGRSIVISGEKLAELHNEFLYAGKNLRDFLNLVAVEPLTENMLAEYRQLNARLDTTIDLEKILYSFFEQLDYDSVRDSASARTLLQAIYESLRILLDTTYNAISTGDQSEFELLKVMTANQRERFTEIRAKYSAQCDKTADLSLSRVLQSTHLIERSIYLLADYVRLRLDKAEAAAGGDASRKSRQKDLL
ncbi:MAG: TRIC cation channel family protein [Desulfuromonadaceae bacterium]